MKTVNIFRTGSDGISCNFCHCDRMVKGESVQPKQLMVQMQEKTPNGGLVIRMCETCAKDVRDRLNDIYRR